MEVPVAGMTDDHRQQAMRLDIGLRLADAVRQARDRHADVGRWTARHSGAGACHAWQASWRAFQSLLRSSAPTARCERAAAALGRRDLAELRRLQRNCFVGAGTA